MNETLLTDLTGSLKSIKFDEAFNVTATPEFIVAILAAWLFPLILYLLWGALAQARTASGQVLARKAISSPNFWVAVVIWFFIQGTLLLLIIFPVWIKLLNP